MTSGRRLVSRNAVYAAAILIAAHVLIHIYVVEWHILYDQGGFEGLLWWLVAFLVLPVAALLTLVSSAITRWLKRKNPAGE